MTATVPPVLEFDAATHTYRTGGRVVKSVTQILEYVGISDWSVVPRDVLQHAQDRGTAVHQACWYDDQNDLDPDSLDPEVVPYLQAWQKFRAETGAGVVLCEKRGLGDGYAFTFDRLLSLPKWGAVMAEIKTGDETPAWRVQLAAYVKGHFGHLSPNCRRLVVKLRKDGKYSLIWYEQRDMVRDWNVFAGAVAVVNYRKEFGIL